MKKILIACLAIFALGSNAFAQEEYSIMPKVGDVRAGLGWGWALNLHFDGTPHSKPINPIFATADYTFLTFAEDKGSLAGGAMFEFCNYRTWSTDRDIQTLGFKTTHTWTNGVLVGTATVRYVLTEGIEVYGMVFLGRNFQLGYKEEYSDESYAAIIPHTSGPGDSPADGIRIGFTTHMEKKLYMSVFAGLGGYTTVGFLGYYKF